MTGASILILFVVVINQAVVRDILALNSADTAAATTVASSAEQVHGDSAINDLEQRQQQQQLQSLLPKLEQLNQLRAMEMMGHDEDHSSIEIDKLNESPRYEIVRSVSLSEQPLARLQQQQQGDAYNLARLVSKIMSLNRYNELMRMNQVERKRNSRLALNKEDKDYSFVAAMAPSADRSYSPYETKANEFQQLQHRANNGKWTAQKLRDLIQSNEQTLRFAPEPNHNSDQLSQVNSRSFADLNIEDTSDIMPKNREKRRRCKIDPNLGVKNPSFCDTDAYFGAADYSMRNVWDSAGR